MKSHTYQNGKQVRSPTYNAWRAMFDRCERPKNRAFKWYGMRGIKICSRWNSFSNFLHDMGEAPQKKWLERIDNNLGYEPNNCRWATVAEQQRNRRSNKFVSCRGERMVIVDAEIKLGLTAGRLKKYLHRHPECKGDVSEIVWRKIPH